MFISQWPSVVPWNNHSTKPMNSLGVRTIVQVESESAEGSEGMENFNGPCDPEICPWSFRKVGTWKGVSISCTDLVPLVILH